MKTTTTKLNANLQKRLDFWVADLLHYGRDVESRLLDCYPDALGYFSRFYFSLKEVKKLSQFEVDSNGTTVEQQWKEHLETREEDHAGRIYTKHGLAPIIIKAFSLEPHFDTKKTFKDAKRDWIEHRTLTRAEETDRNDAKSHPARQRKKKRSRKGDL